MSAWFIVVFVLAALLALVLNVAALSVLRQQRSEKVTGAHGRKYRVLISPTGFPWIAWTNFDGSWVIGSVSALRHFRQPRTWTVAVKDARDWRRGDPIRAEVLLDWNAEARRFKKVVAKTHGLGSE